MDALITKNEKKMTENALQRCEKKVAPHTPPGGPYSIIGIQTPLSPIQFGTLGWMLEREASKTLGQGGIVAHGMGIGKTLIALALMAVKGTSARARKDVDAPTLVVVPSHIVINHWIEEAKKHAPETFPPRSIVRYNDLRRVDLEKIPSTVGVVFLDSRIKESAKNILEQSIKEKEQAKVAIYKATSSVASLLHLYRYAAVHSFMLENTLIRLFKPEDLEKMADDMAAIAENDQDANGPLSLQVIFRLARQDQQLLGLVCLSCKAKCGTLSEHIFKAGANKSRFLRYSDQYMMKLGMVVPSARLSKIEFLLKKWQREAPNDKIIGS
ncbi:unnamed protein product [Parascedosporium putredinis]|uniref:SNF2 N-terminal domain-containing protein n=1 Tax=Parascedosporium putredinis TaxID=1442378 RepID=A0A9P1GWJ6_9PEZI|nr:unnamed protein product [Parascedosporium putredinis]CAI7988378.1 unnamed protein product [Parascedosporium putredinis]